MNLVNYRYYTMYISSVCILIYPHRRTHTQ